MSTLLALLLAASLAAPDDGAAVKPARAKSNLASLIRNGDYPEAADKAMEQGFVHFELDVGANGRVTACRVTGSSGSASLDAATCTIMVKRARFVPARDAGGAATSGTVRSRIGWFMAP
jgi:protein TonB